MFKKRKNTKKRRIRDTNSQFDEKEDEQEAEVNLDLIKRDQKTRKNAFKANQIEVRVFSYSRKPLFIANRG